MRFALLVLVLSLAACGPEPEFDTIIEGGTVYDGSGDAPVDTDVGIVGDQIAEVGDLSNRTAQVRVDATGMAVSPGFVNMLSWAPEPLLQDGRGLSDLLQGVTLEVFGEGESMGPLNSAMKAKAQQSQGRIQYEVDWTTLGQFLESLERRGISPNVASFIGAATVRTHVIGEADRAATEDELNAMKALVRQAMEDGAVGVGSSLIYTPGAFASTEELIALSSVAAEFDGLYISHLRSEGDRLMEAVEELITIASEAGIRAEIYHLKAAGRENWDKLQQVIDRVEAVRAEGLQVSADIYAYTAGATGLDAAMPPWVREGGFGEWRSRLMDPVVRSRVAAEMRARADGWENLMRASGPEGTLLVGFRQDSLRYLIGRTLGQIAESRGLSPEETAMDLVIADSSRVSTIYFMMSEDNVRKKMRTDWITFGSDAGAIAPEEPFTASNPHPRAYGNFARVLGRYVREEQQLPLQDAIHRMTALPAERLRIDRRGRITAGYFADVVLFDPATVSDRATFENPHQLSIGVQDVWVNGVRVVASGSHTGALPGRALRRSDASSARR